MPGEESGHHEPTWVQTSVDGKRKGLINEWYPIWNNRILSEPTEGLTTSLEGAILTNIEAVRARGAILVVQVPNVENHFTTIVRFDDDPQLGADYYRVRLTFWKPPSHVRWNMRHLRKNPPAPFSPPTPLDPAPIQRNPFPKRLD